MDQPPEIVFADMSTSSDCIFDSILNVDVPCTIIMPDFGWSEIIIGLQVIPLPCKGA